MKRTLPNIVALMMVNAGIFQVEGQQSQPGRSDSSEINPGAVSVGSGFFISEDGFFITNQHVVADAMEVRLLIGDEAIPAKVVKSDPADDLALLKAKGTFAALPIASSRTVKLETASRRSGSQTSSFKAVLRSLRAEKSILFPEYEMTLVTFRSAWQCNPATLGARLSMSTEA